MICQEKLDLQRACTTAWASYETHTREAGIVAGDLPDLLKFHKMMSGMWNRSDTFGQLASTFRNAVRMRGEHLRASRALSLHLSRHR
jgi:hypothetical protein